MSITPDVGRGALQTTTRAEESPCHRSSHRALNLTPQDHLGRACHIASPLAHCCLQEFLNALREGWGVDR